ncbi:MAG: FHA domain-containing protein [Marinagarivorans sp.]|nr:FHA domain-containing protein [Marinagarivorans sp.]
MAIVVEFINRAGHALAFQRVEANRLLIGRGFNQTVILEDDYVDPSHAEIVLDEQTGDLTCVDLASANGLILEPAIGKKRDIVGAAKFMSGDILVVGRTRLKIFRDNHVVPPARKFSLGYQFAHKYSVWPVFVVLLIALFLLDILVSYLQMPVAESLKLYALQSGYAVLLVFFSGAFWGLIGRTLRGDGRLITHLLMAVTLLLIAQLVGLVLPWLTYHLAWQALSEVLNRLAVGLLGGLFVFLSLRAATKMRRVQTVSVAALIPLGLIITLLINSFGQQDNVNHVPYLKALIAPSVNVRIVIPSSVFVGDTHDLFQKATKNVDSSD